MWLVSCHPRDFQSCCPVLMKTFEKHYILYIIMIDWPRLKHRCVVSIMMNCSFELGSLSLSLLYLVTCLNVLCTISLACGGAIHAQSGVVKSPEHPGLYPYNTECTWTINVLPGYHILLTFLPPFDLEISDGCTHDYLQVPLSLLYLVKIKHLLYCRSLDILV